MLTRAAVSALGTGQRSGSVCHVFAFVSIPCASQNTFTRVSTSLIPPHPPESSKRLSRPHLMRRETEVSKGCVLSQVNEELGLKPGFPCFPGLCSFLFMELRGITGRDLDLLIVCARAPGVEPVPTCPWLPSFHISSCHSPFCLATLKLQDVQ